MTIHRMQFDEWSFQCSWYRTIDSMASVRIIFLLCGGIRTRNYLCLAPIFQPTTLCQEGEKNNWILQFLLLRMAGIKPGPPAQRASTLSITQLPLSHLALFNMSLCNFSFTSHLLIYGLRMLFTIVRGVRDPQTCSPLSRTCASLFENQNNTF